MSATLGAAAPDDDAADRIERALERIAARGDRPREPVAASAALGMAVDPALAPRLDAVIARLRQTLGD